MKISPNGREPRPRQVCVRVAIPCPVPQYPNSCLYQLPPTAHLLFCASEPVPHRRDHLLPSFSLVFWRKSLPPPPAATVFPTAAVSAV